MYSRLITCTIKPDSVDEFRNAINNEFLPRIQAQPGFLENIESCDPDSRRYVCLTLWKSRADVGNYDQGLFPEMAARLSPLMDGPRRWRPCRSRTLPLRRCKLER